MTRATDTEQRAAAWIIRSEAGNFTEEMRASRDQWLANPLHRVTYIRIQEAWRRAGRVRSVRPLDGHVDPDLLKDSDLGRAPAKSTSRSRWPLRIAGGAIVTLIIYLTTLLFWSTLGSGAWISYTTGVGGHQNVTLSDGTDLQLNTDTEVRTRMTPQKREVQLLRGEALINIVRDQQRPFTVLAGSTALKTDFASTGRTAFSIRMRTPDGIDIAMKEGRALLGSSERIIDVALGRVTPSQSVVDAGELVHVRPEGILLVNVGLDEINRKLTWVDGLLTFQGETLAEVIDEFNRFNRRHMVVVDPSIADRRIGGAFHYDDPDSFVSALRKGFGVRADEQQLAGSDNTVIRLSRKN